ncbi:hypothetical protein ACEN9H_29710 [Massilia cellulosiltytica]|uniref:hypothetical protein n=1 Tax=Massilia cellulosiltytica TaxID=2683234 RepID=UPI0039B3DD5D
MGKNLIIDPEFKALIPPLQEEEYAALEQSILRDGCRDALVVWNNILVDGHNRYEICKRNNKSFRTTTLERVDSRESAMAWMINNQLARRNLTDFQRSDLALKMKDALAALAQKKQKAGVNQHSSPSTNLSKGSSMDTRRDLAKAAGVSEGTLAKVEKIKISAVPEILEMARSEEIKIDVAAQVATLPKEEQVALAAAGKDAMKSAAKNVRKSKQDKEVAEDAAQESKERTANPKPEIILPPEDDDELARLRIENAVLRKRVDELTTASEKTEIENQLAEAQAEVQRLTDVCAELNSRIAILEKENDVLVQRQDMQDQKDCQQQLEGNVDDRTGDVLEETAESAATVQPASAPQSVLTDAVVD